jgi:hypothetical protein
MTTVIQSGAFPLEEYGMGREFGIVHFIAYPFDAVSYPKLMPGPHYIVFGEEIGSTATNAALRDLWVDWVVVRTFAVVDPTTTVGAEESLP